MAIRINAMMSLLVLVTLNEKERKGVKRLHCQTQNNQWAGGEVAELQILTKYGKL
jgi:hypothetical protein